MRNEPETSSATAAPRRLYRSREDRMIAGVCGGIAGHLGIDPLIVRVGAIALALAGGAGVPVYVAAWLLTPRAEPSASQPVASAAEPVRVVNLVDDLSPMAPARG
jgi:phage shock protein C